MISYIYKFWLYDPFGWRGEVREMEENKVELDKNKLILY